MTATNKTDVYSIVTEKIIARLEAGVVPWHKPWAVSGMNGTPRNLKSLKCYRGINVILLAGLHDSPFWLTYKQAQELGGNVRKGEKSSLVVYWNWVDRTKEDAQGNEKVAKIPFMRYYHVFNVEQCEGLESSVEAAKTKLGFSDAPVSAFSPIETAEALVAGMPSLPQINHGGDRACYSPDFDIVKMPAKEAFESPEHYYGTLLHELTHATGHSSRLNRDLTGSFGSDKYGKEELVAEMGAAFLCGLCGITDRLVDQSAAYLAGWIKVLKGDSKLVVQAAQAAQKAADFIAPQTHAEVEAETALA